VNFFRQHRVPMALASDANPGTSPVLSLRLMLSMGCTLFGLTPEEALAGITCHGARARFAGLTARWRGQGCRFYPLAARDRLNWSTGWAENCPARWSIAEMYEENMTYESFSYHRTL
jgi:hypothetical protein